MKQTGADTASADVAAAAATAAAAAAARRSEVVFAAAAVRGFRHLRLDRAKSSGRISRESATWALQRTAIQSFNLMQPMSWYTLL
jgi:hypothetical protein